MTPKEALEYADNPEKRAVEVLKCALAWEPDARLIGNVRAADIAALAAGAIDTCPKCGATAWVNIDCDLCTVCFSLAYAEPERARVDHAAIGAGGGDDDTPQCQATYPGAGKCVFVEGAGHPDYHLAGGIDWPVSTPTPSKESP